MRTSGAVERSTLYSDTRGDRRRLLWLIAIMATVVIVATWIGGAMLYQAAFDGERDRLVDMVHSQARLIAAVARQDNGAGHEDYAEGAVAPHGHAAGQKDHDEDAAATNLGQVLKAYHQYEGNGERGEFNLGRCAGENIDFLLVHEQEGGVVEADSCVECVQCPVTAKA